MSRQRIRETTLLFVTVLLLAAARPLHTFAQKPSPGEDAASLLQSILLAHRAWIAPPGSIRIHGTSIRGNSRQAVTITATEQEEVVIEHGPTKSVVTPTARFQDDGRSSAFASSGGAFDQLDITGLFLISQLAQRRVLAGEPEVLASKEGRITKIRLSTGRATAHFRQIPVADELDVFVNGSGLLAAVERTMYLSDSRLRYTLGYRFSNYRDNAGVLLPYRIETIFKGNVEETILVTDYQVNAAVAPSLFQSRSQSRSTR